MLVSDTGCCAQKMMKHSKKQGASTRTHPAKSHIRQKLQCHYNTGVFGGRGWITQAAHLKRPRRGLFAAGTYSGGRCCSNPPLRRFTNFQIKQKLQCHYNTGVLGGRGWIRTSSTITIRWMRFEIVMDSCVFFECHRKSIIGYHNHLGTKTGYKVGYFARGEYSARASETAIAAVSALPSTA